MTNTPPDWPTDMTPEAIADWIAKHPEYTKPTELSDIVFGPVPGSGGVSSSTVRALLKRDVKLTVMDRGIIRDEYWSHYGAEHQRMIDEMLHGLSQASGDDHD